MSASVEIFLSCCDDAGDTPSSDLYSDQVLQLEKQFGHVTRTVVTVPSSLWPRHQGIILKVSVSSVDIDWWRTYRLRLQADHRVSNVRVWATTPHPL